MKIKKLVKKYWILFLLAIVTIGIIIFTIISIVFNKPIQNYSNDLFSINYDNSWRIKSSKESLLELVHIKSKSGLIIEEVELQEEYRYATIGELIDELIYSIEKQNKNYKLLSREDTTATKNNYSGYKLLYEDTESQSLVVIVKDGSKLYMFTYSAKYEYFDIVLDSAQNIINSYESNEGKSAEGKVEINTTQLKWSENSSISKMSKKLAKDEIANNNYRIKYSYPSFLKLLDYDTTNASYTHKAGTKSIQLLVSVFGSNIYEYINQKDGKLYKETKSLKNVDGYSNFSESIEVQEVNGKKRYIYKRNYDMDIGSKIYNKEDVVILYELNKNHIVLFKTLSDFPLPVEYVNNIKLESFENYANNVERNIADNKLIGTLKKFNDYTKEKTTVITLRLPVEYKEEDHDVNMYDYRYYGLNYNGDYYYYQYEVKYTYLDSSFDLAIDGVNSDYDSNNYKNHSTKLVSSGTMILNGREYHVYDGNYVSKKNSVIGVKDVSTNVKYLVCKAGPKYLRIEVKGNGVQISDDILLSITDFDIEEI